MSERPIRKSTPWIRFLPLVVLVVVVLAVGYWKRDLLFTGKEESSPEPASTSEGRGGATGPGAGEDPADGRDEPESWRRWREATGAVPEWPEDLDQPGDCRSATARLQALCARLDDRPYVRAWALPEGTYRWLTEISRDLGARPPAVGGELRSHGSILRSVSHLFRTLGERRIRRLAEIAVLEPEMREPLAMALYRWARVRERCDGDETRAMSLDSQYEYAAWLLSTVGGQAYLRRRAPDLESLACFYALLILDRAEEKGHNPHGVDLRPEIRRCIGLVRGGDLVFRDRYLEVLDEMNGRWKDR